MKLQLFESEHQTTVIVTLSRRNLLALLHKLEMPGSARLLLTDNCERQGKLVDDLCLVLHVEDDLEHYGRRGYGPGAMHPVTKVFIAATASRKSDVSQIEPVAAPETDPEHEASDHEEGDTA